MNWNLKQLLTPRLGGHPDLYVKHTSDDEKEQEITFCESNEYESGLVETQSKPDNSKEIEGEVES